MASIKNTLKAYRVVLKQLDSRLSTVANPRDLKDAVLADFLTHLHESGKSPATISQVVAAVRWQSTNTNWEIVKVITIRRATEIRGDGQDRAVSSDMIE